MKLVIAKRDQYIAAWQGMYWCNKQGYNQEQYDGVNPMLNKVPLKTELDDVCTIAVLEAENFDLQDPRFGSEMTQKAVKMFGGLPVGIHSMLVTRALGRNGSFGSVKVIGKQWVVAPDQMNKGIGTTMLLFLEQELMKAGYEWYYIGCSSMSSRIMRKLGREPYSGSDEHDLYKFDIKLNQQKMDEMFHQNFVIEQLDDTHVGYRHAKSGLLWEPIYWEGFELLANPEAESGQ